MQSRIQDPHKRELWEKTVAADRAKDENQADLWHSTGSFQIGGLPRVQGREAIRSFLAGFFSQGLFVNLDHEMEAVWETPDALIYRAVAVYTLANGTVLRSPYVNTVTHKDGLFDDYRVFIDTHPLFAAIAR